MRLREILRREPAVETTSKGTLQVSALPTLEQILKRADGLPEDRRSFFLPLPLEDEELLVGRSELLEQLDRAMENWQNGRLTSVALVGPQGCGKTSVINCFLRRQSEDREILRCEMRRRLWSEGLVLEFFCRLFHVDDPLPDDVESLIARLLKYESRLIVLEGAHNILLRVIGGRKAAEIFLYVLLCTRKRHFWLFTCRRLPWNDMERYLEVSRHFSHVWAIDSLTEDQLRDALDLRLVKSGLPVAFCRSRIESEQRSQAEAGEKEGRDDAFFSAVFANSGVNFSAALYFLLLCSRYEAHTRTLFLWPPDHLDMGFIKEMDHLYLLTLAELAGHGVLSVKEHERIFRTSSIRTRTVFEYLEQSRLVEPLIVENDDDEEKTYDLSPVIHHAVTLALEQRNLLY